MTAEGHADRDGRRLAGLWPGARRGERVTNVGQDLDACELCGELEAPEATAVVLGTRTAGDVAVEDIRRDREVTRRRDPLRRSSLDVVEPEQLAEHDRGAQPASAGRPGKVRPHRMTIERGDGDVLGVHAAKVPPAHSMRNATVQHI